MAPLQPPHLPTPLLLPAPPPQLAEGEGEDGEVRYLVKWHGYEVDAGQVGAAAWCLCRAVHPSACAVFSCSAASRVLQSWELGGCGMPLADAVEWLAREAASQGAPAGVARASLTQTPALSCSPPLSRTGRLAGGR